MSVSRRDFLCTAGASVAGAMLWPGLTGGGAGRARAEEPGPPPNIIVCMVDDMGFSDPGCFGGEIMTPNLDALAANGVRFCNFHNTSRCCPSRASILTGLYPHQVGMGYMTKDTGHPAYRGGIKNPCLSIAECMAPAGYGACLSGKWHVGIDPKRFGFDTAETWFRDGATSFFYRFDEEGKPSGKTDPAFYATDYFADGVVDNIKKNAGKRPFFVYWTPTAPHYPIHAKEEDVRKYRDLYAKLSPAEIATRRHQRLVEMGIFDKSHPWSVPKVVSTPEENFFAEYRLDTSPLERQEGFKKRNWKSGKYDPYGNTTDLGEVMSMYAAMLDRFDQGLGRVLKTLKETGQFDNTLILFCSDNGCSGEILNIGQQLSNASTTPFLKTKKSAFNGGIGTPLIMHWPAKTAPAAKGSINQSFGHLVDVLPTCLEAGGARYLEKDRDGNAAPALEGRSLLGALQGETVALEKPIGIEHAGNCAVITEEWKLTVDGGGPWNLYNLKTDRFERKNVAAEHPETVQTLAAEWEAWAKRVQALRHGQPKAKKKKKAKPTPATP